MAHNETPIPNPETHDWFTKTEWETFRLEDLQAGRFVIVLMTTIFLIGILIYSIVLWSMF